MKSSLLTQLLIITVISVKTSGYAKWFTAGAAIHIAHYDVIDDVITRKLYEIERNRDHLAPWNPLSYPMVENRIALRQLLQNRKLRHLWRYNLGSRWKLQKMARENFSTGALYNTTKHQDNPIKTVGRDSFLSPQTPKNTRFFKGDRAPRGRTAPIFYGTQLDPDV